MCIGREEEEGKSGKKELGFFRSDNNLKQPKVPTYVNGG